MEGSFNTTATSMQAIIMKLDTAVAASVYIFQSWIDFNFQRATLSYILILGMGANFSYRMNVTTHCMKKYYP